MYTDLACVPAPPGTGDASIGTNGCESGSWFTIYDESCTVRSSYGVPDCGVPFYIEENFLDYVLIMEAIDTGIGEGWFSFLYGDGRYSIRNNQCVCVDDGGGLEARQACRCAFPVNGHFVGKRSINVGKKSIEFVA
jgi:hypothetical protein